MVAMITAAAGFHITFYSVPPMRLQRRPSAAPHYFPRSLVAGRPYLGTAEAIHPANSPPRCCVGAAGGGPVPADGPGEDQQRDDSGHDPRTTRACHGFIVALLITPPAAASSASWAMPGMLIADEAYVPFLRRIGACDDAMVARWSADPRDVVAGAGCGVRCGGNGGPPTTARRRPLL